MSRLLVPADKTDTQIQSITPRTAGWQYVGFSAHMLADGIVLEAGGNEDEICLVLLSGSARIEADGIDFGALSSRSSVFDRQPPVAVYLPFRLGWKVTALTACELAICTAPGIAGAHPPRLITPDMMPLEQRGTGSNTRFVCNILPETEPADSLLVVEVITPSGNWSSYPPHKHDTDNLPHESLLEETYYHRINPEQGYVLHHVYDDARTLDEVMAAPDKSVVLVPRGYHPVGVPHGYESYYLNVMAGPKRIWKFHNDPAHEWIIGKEF